ncbi:MAG TPA: site-specific integrase [Dehalococcoidia bacterium]|nr:hypothetical protein [Dehalococcoidia bacterium]MQG29996.1 site-specific integrase [SAR202 cluster bacterium]HAG54821.1 hypothetical protein [Dehalococcoidia bacterium]HIM60599.1 site-specific integrase [Dehalococcoidia bacterium]
MLNIWDLITACLFGSENRDSMQCHSFRRLFAYEAIRKCLNLFHVQSLVGHSTLEMTRLYAHQVGSEDALQSYRPSVEF